MRILDLNKTLLLNRSEKSVVIGIQQDFHLMSEIHLNKSDIQRRFPTHADVCGCQKTFSDMS